jgi:antibiotic biosynthesis monooxygenase (ABM) superfamily enzyme
MSKHIQHKRTFLIWLAIYPIVTIVFGCFGDFLMQFPLMLRTLLLTLVVVPLASYVVLPFYQKIFSKWLNKP